MSTIKCPQCNLVSWASDPVCKRCGLAFQPVDKVEGYDPQPEMAAHTEAREPQAWAGETEAFPRPAPVRRATARPEPGHHDHQRQAGKPRIGMAVFSMILGILGMPPFSTFGGVAIGGILALIFGAGGFIAGLLLVLAVMPAGLITGIVSMRRANRLPYQYGGKGFAIAGIVCSLLAAVTLSVVAVIAVPNLMASLRAANEGAAISTIRKLASAEEIFMKDLGSGHCGDLDILTGVSLIDNTFAKGEKSGYRFMILKLPRGGCEIHATPLSASKGNRTFFYSTTDGAIRATSERGRQAGMNDARIDDPYSKEDELPAKIALQKGR